MNVSATRSSETTDTTMRTPATDAATKAGPSAAFAQALDTASAEQPGAPADAAEQTAQAEQASGLSEAQREAARDMLTELPPPLAKRLARSPLGSESPVPTFDVLFEVTASGEFVPTADQLGGRSLVARVAAAVEVFDSPEQMWDAMREVLGAPPLLQQAVEQARAQAGDTSEPAPASASAVTPATEGAGAVEQPLDVLGGEIPADQLDWWEMMARYLLIALPADLAGEASAE